MYILFWRMLIVPLSDLYFTLGTPIKLMSDRVVVVASLPFQTHVMKFFSAAHRKIWCDCLPNM